MNQQLVQTSPPDKTTEELRTFWREMGREMVRGSEATLDSTARQIVAVAGILQGLYFNAVALGALGGQSWGEWAFYLAPLFLLLLSLSAALWVFFPGHYKDLNLLSSEAFQVIHRRVVRRKVRRLRLSAICLALGVAAVGVAVGVYMV